MIPHNPNHGPAPRRPPPTSGRSPAASAYTQGPPPVRHLVTGGSPAESRPCPHMGMSAAGRAVST